MWFFKDWDAEVERVAGMQANSLRMSQELRATIRNLENFDIYPLLKPDVGKLPVKRKHPSAVSLINLRCKGMNKFKILTTPGDASLIFTNFLEDFAAKFKQCVISIENIDSCDFSSMGNIDLCYLPFEVDDNSFSFDKIDSSEIQAFASEKYLELNGTPKSFPELQQHKVIKRTRAGDILAKHYQKGIEINDMCPTVIEVPTGQAYVDLCVKGMGIAFIQPHIVKLNNLPLKKLDFSFDAPVIHQYIGINRKATQDELIAGVRTQLTSIFH